MAQIGVIVRLMERALQLLPVGSEPWKDMAKSMNQLARHVPPNPAMGGVENTAMKGIMQQQQQMAPLIAQMRGAPAAPSGPQPQPGPGA